MTKSKYFLLICFSFILGIAVGSFFSLQIWILFLLVGFSISLIFLYKINIIPPDNILSTGDYIIPPDKNLLTDDYIVPPDKGGWGVRDNHLLVILLTVLIFFSLGFIRIEDSKLGESEIVSIESLDGQEMSLEGNILQSPSVTNGKQKILLGNIKSENQETVLPESGKMIIYPERYPESVSYTHLTLPT